IKQHGNHFSGYEFALGIRFGIKIISPRSGYLNFLLLFSITADWTLREKSWRFFRMKYHWFTEVSYRIAVKKAEKC
ncbi:MAG: hypothetical protein HW390_1569, partial [Candidatus Brocadiaceae bacterium]|nr:hypothetical protein [Candidatus Brocadiaceae bacterium]